MPLLSEYLRPAFRKFVDEYVPTLDGDEKGEAQPFLEHFFRALGHAGTKEAGAILEYRIAKRPGSEQLELLADEPEVKKKRSGGKKFADLLWPDRVLIEMKRRGEHLEKHYDQLFGYWTQIVPKRPPYAILCNFDEFWIYDLNEQLYEPVDRIATRDLPTRWRSFTFLAPQPDRPIFDNNRVEVTRSAASRMAQVFRLLIGERGFARPRAQRFILQLLVALVSEDLDLLPNSILTRILGEALENPRSSYNLLDGLFRAMNSRKSDDGGRFADVKYFNGGLFAEIDPIELKLQELTILQDAAKEDWSAVKPDIFGTLFQQSMDKGERHAYGAHFTSEFDIQKVVGPTITRPWRERVAAAKTRTQLRALLTELRRFTVLDPACGSGNFLYVAYREMRRLERDILVRLRDQGESADKLVSAVSLMQFFGIDKVPFAAELARVTLMLAKELELLEAKKTEETDGLLVFETPLPLDNLNGQIVCADALFTAWPKVDVIIGNPPFQSKNKMQVELGVEYLQTLRQEYPEVPGRADFCVYWFRKAHDHLAAGGRAGLVGTNTIRQNYSREGGLDYIVAKGGTITEAVSTEVWSGDAAVHVSIVNWIKGVSPGSHRLSTQRGDAIDSPWDHYDLPVINSALSPGTDVSGAIRLDTNARAAACFQGQTHGHEGFLLTLEQARAMVKTEPRCAEVLFPFLTADELVAKMGSKPGRCVIDFQGHDAVAASSFKPAYDHVRKLVLPARKKAAEEEAKRNAPVLKADPDAKVNQHHANFLNKWWQLSYGRSRLMNQLKTLPRYITCGRVTKRPIFEFVSTAIHPNDALMVFPLEDDYSFGILQSDVHWAWFAANCSSLKGDYRYTSDTVFDTFPWPQRPTAKQIQTVAAAAVELRALRGELLAKHGYSLRELYRTLDVPGDNPLRNAHTTLDGTVRAAYGMGAKIDPLVFLLDLNRDCASREGSGGSVVGPGLPLRIIRRAEDRAALTTTDCVTI